MSVLRNRRKQKQSNGSTVVTSRLLVIGLVSVFVITHLFLGVQDLKSCLNIASHHYEDVDEWCKSIPKIRPAGSYFHSSKISSAKSPEGVVPPFSVGSVFKQNRATNHMRGDAPVFKVIREILKGKEGGLAFDIGANQGFYSYFLAALGMEVHAFEINENNFKALQQGVEFNPVEMSKHVNFYPVGLGETNSRFSLKGGTYDGHLETKDGGSILGVSFDCFAYHVHETLDLSDIPFMKIDVEGFEIAVLKGAQKSIFKHSRVGALYMEVGPARWSRASVDFASGVVEMKRLAEHFTESFIILRGNGANESCPANLGESVLSDHKPEDLGDGLNMFKVNFDEFDTLLDKMRSNGYDCNFLYKN